MMSFYLTQVFPDGRETPVPGYHFDKGSEASFAAKRLSFDYGVKIQPRPMAEAADWRPREEARLKAGSLTPLPDGWDLPPIKDHYACVGGEQGRMITYFESESAGLFDRRTSLTPGRYLRRYHKDVTEADRRRLTAIIDPPPKVLFAESADEMVRVYVNGPESCMAYEMREGWEGLGIHPIEVYAAGDLQVAYLADRARPTRVTARAIVWPERKLYGRVYGDIERLTMALEGLGFQYAESFVGARIAAIKPDNHHESEAYVLPYFDNIGALILDKDVFIAIEENKYPDRVYLYEGYSGIGMPYRHCQKIKEWARSNSFYRVRGVEQEWSSRACNHFAFRCDATHEFWPIECRIAMGDHRSWSKEYFDKHGFTCDGSGRHWPLAEKVVGEDGKSYHRTYLDRLKMREAAKSYENIGLDDYYRYDAAPWSRTTVNNPQTYRYVELSGRQADLFVHADRDAALADNRTATVVVDDMEAMPDGPRARARDTIESYLRDVLERNVPTGLTMTTEQFRSALERPEFYERHPRHVERPAWAEPDRAEIRSTRRGR